MKHSRRLSAITLLALSGLGLAAKGQTISPESQNLDINKIKAAHMVHGDMWYSLVDYMPQFEFPKGSEKHASYAGGLWLTARDAKGDLHAAAAIYRTGGVDYYPGPLNDTGFCPAPVSASWSRIWKINVSDIIAFKSLSTRTLSTVPENILIWPAKGNIYARGAGGASLSVSDEMAPFVDTDGDGIYNALNGDYPKMKGDQMLWWVFNDNTGTTHPVSRGLALRAECRVSAYAYSRGTAVDRMLFYEFDIRNKSVQSYNEFRAGLFSEFDIGCPFDDYMVFDSATRTAVTLNGQIPDCNNGKNSYGDHPPVVGYTMVETPGDVYPSTLTPPGAFNTFENSPTGTFRVPARATEFENYMKGVDADGNPVVGYPYFYSRPGSTMCDMKVPLKDWRFVMTSGSAALPAGGRTKFALAVVTTDTVGGWTRCATTGTPVIGLADTAWKVYWNPLTSLTVSEFAELDTRLSIYPNPARGKVWVHSFTGRRLRSGFLKIFDLLGRSIDIPVQEQTNGLELNVEQLPAGTYQLVYQDAERKASATFVKQ